MGCSKVLQKSRKRSKPGGKPQKSPLSLDLEANGFCGHDGITNFNWRKGEEDVKVEEIMLHPYLLLHLGLHSRSELALRRHTVSNQTHDVIPAERRMSGRCSEDICSMRSPRRDFPTEENFSH